MNSYTFALIVFVLAFPFGFWRVRTKFRSAQWMLAIHIPVLFIILLRIFNKMYFSIGFTFKSLIFNVIAFFLAQYLAGVIYKRFHLRKHKKSRKN